MSAKPATAVEKCCFFCDGTGQMCNICGESVRACDCDEIERDEAGTYDCDGCKGTGKVMVSR